EYHYFAVDYLRRNAGRCSSGFLPVARRLVTTTSWWDTVDPLAAHVVGALVAADPGLAAAMDDWIADDDLWVARTALLHQLSYKGRTDSDRLFAYCLRQSGHPDFFVRKAVGWCLREYAKTDPEAVRDFLARERGRFAPLSVREALKNIGV
ncbi:DNA alkylation repair protein, partial [Streptomyces sp. NPDC002920]